MLRNSTFRSSVFIHHCFFSKQSMSTVKSSKLLSVIRSKPLLINKSEYKLIYNYPFIRFIGPLYRSGKTNFFLTCAATPFIYYYTESVGACIAILSGASIHLGMVTLFSRIFENIVGKIYVNKEGEVKNILFSCVNKSGSRIDRIHKPDEILCCDYHTKITGKLGFVQITAQNDDTHYKVNLKDCKIHDQILWENLFGKNALSEFSSIVQNKKNEVKKIE